MTTVLGSDVPVDDTITIAQLTEDPYPIYRRLRAEAPVLRVPAVNRILLTKAADTKYVKDNWELFSSDDPLTPMARAFQTQTLMRKDGEAHKRERNAMAPAFSPKNIRGCWQEIYTKVAEDYVGRLPRGETVDLFTDLAAPYAARCLTHLLGIPEATDDQMIRWSQTLIDGAGNFGNVPALYERSDAANDEMNALFDACADRARADPDASALSAMVNADDPIETRQIYSNIKIAIGGGINEPRDAFLTILFGLFTNPDQRDACVRDAMWDTAFEEGVRWVAPIQASSRLVTQDCEIRGHHIAKGEVVMTIQASACRDEEVYGEAEDYNIFRPRAPHQAFGNGPHFCQGTHIARRMLAQILLPMIFDRFPNMTLPDPGVVKFRGFGFRGPLSLPVTLN
ncbi:Cytochrome P450 [Pseudooceanicola nitratireducens]|jgi:cytochrome P450|uniref:Cytochrome P450 n=1 Tax=Pseudooceanicola nitratireducens TaxID=517719 RepID=A0A1I1K972_9RHOB|nr:cytochrome P450 [Pseudooceanicola nitratireducens]SEJ50175.1 Cytochrome P450 [Pseudooceanicola nitratireducens]SFC54080.1 Cytochrome P450 [Pseudooceanicola nitratireducens]